MSKIKIKVYVSTNIVGSDRQTEMEVDADEWAAMSEVERLERAREVMFEMIEWGYEGMQ